MHIFGDAARAVTRGCRLNGAGLLGESARLEATDAQKENARHGAGRSLGNDLHHRGRTSLFIIRAGR